MVTEPTWGGCWTSVIGLVLPSAGAVSPGDSVVASQRFPVRERYILAYRE